MASLIYNEFKRANAAAEIDLNAADIRAALLMSNTTADTENDGIVNLDDFTTLDEFDGSGYARIALTNEAVNKDDANDRAEFDADDIAYGALGAGTRAVQGILLYVEVGADSADKVIAFIQFASNVTMDGSSFTVNINAEGLLQLT